MTRNRDTTMLKYCSLLLLLGVATTTQALDYYHCIDADGNAYFGEEPSAQCKSQFKTLPIVETPAKDDSYYSIENQAKRLASSREQEALKQQEKRKQELELQLLEQKLRNEQEAAKQLNNPEPQNDNRRVVVVPSNPALRPGLVRPNKPEHRPARPENRANPQDEQRDPPPAFKSQ